MMTKLIVVLMLICGSAQAQLHIADVSTQNGGQTYMVRLYNCGSDPVNLKDYAILEPTANNRITDFYSRVLNEGESFTVEIGRPFHMVLMDEPLYVFYDAFYYEIPEGYNWAYRSGYDLDSWTFGKGGLPEYEMDCLYIHPTDVVSFGTMKTMYR